MKSSAHFAILDMKNSHGGLSMAAKDTQQLFSAITAVKNQLFCIYIGSWAVLIF
jgi:hypothetical protein